MNAQFDWDDLKYVLAVSRSTSLTEAASLLGVNQTTVSRRIYSLEEALGSKLFEHIKRNPEPTPACLKLISIAKKTEKNLFDFSTRTYEKETKPSGIVRVTSLDFIFYQWAKDFKEFSDKYKDIDLELVTSSAMADMNKREADVSIRMMSSQLPPHLSGKKIGKVGFAFYSKTQKDEIDLDKETNVNWISHKNSQSQALDKMILKIDKDANIYLRDDSVIFRAHAIRDGLGIGLMPCLYADQFEGIERVSPIVQDYNLYFWIVTHVDIAGTTRIKSFLNYFSKVFESDKRIIQGI